MNAAPHKDTNAVLALRRFVYPQPERCDLCRSRIPADHAHLIELEGAKLRCTCKLCLARYANTDAFRAVSPRKDRLPLFAVTDAEWSAFQIPIDLAFLVKRGQGLTALYPGPAGMITSSPSAQAWEDLAQANPQLSTLRNDVEALLIDRVGGKRDAYLVSIAHCYALAGVIRSKWHGLSGGPEVWNAIEDYLAGIASSSNGDAGHA